MTTTTITLDDENVTVKRAEVTILYGLTDDFGGDVGQMINAAIHNLLVDLKRAGVKFPSSTVVTGKDPDGGR